MPDSRPNIVILTLHDTGRHFGCYGVPGIDTPNIDALAADGVKFDQCFTACPVCSPSRGAMMTGRYPQSNGLMGLVHQPWWWEMNDDERHLSQILADAGYATHLFGIQHETENIDRLGFQHVHKGDQPGNRTARELGDLFTENIGPMVADERPFYAAIGFFETHTDYAFGNATPGDPAAQRVPPFIEDNDAARKHLAGLAGAVKAADDGVGQIVRALEAQGAIDNTIFIFTVDHGVELGRRAKWSCYDAGMEIGLIMRWPNGGLSGGRVIDSLVSNVDVLPSLMQLLGEDVPANVQGQSFKPLLDGDASGARDAVFAMFESDRAPRCIRTESYKLIRNFAPSRPLRLPHDITRRQTWWIPAPFVELYDLRSDPHELKNIADDPAHAETLRLLDARLLQWLRDVDDPILKGPIATPYYEQAIADMTSPH